MLDTNQDITGVVTDKLVLRTWDTYDLTEDAKLDKYSLDVEAERQAELMTKWLSILNQAETVLAKAQGDLDYAEAELRIAAKRDGIDGIAKVTDATIEAWVTLHPKRKKANDARVSAFATVQYLKNAKQVLEQKRDMIKVLDHLLVAGFYARPSVSSKSVDISEDMIRNEANEQLRITLAKRQQLTDNEE